MRSRNYCIFVVIIAVFLFLPFLGISEVIEIKNKDIIFSIDDRNFRFSLQRENLPTKDYLKNLLFHTIPPTSYVSVNIDGIPYKFGSREGNIIKYPVVEDNSIVCVWSIENIYVTLSFKVLSNKNTGNYDSLGVSVEVRNDSELSRNLSIRYLLDTVFGEDDPQMPKFFLDGKTPIDYELLVTYQNMISFLVSAKEIDSVNKLYIQWNKTPSKILFSNWRRLDISEWYVEPSRELRYRFSEQSSQDAAVAIFFENIVLLPGQKNEFIVTLSPESYVPEVEKVDIAQEPTKSQIQEAPTLQQPKEQIIVTNYVFQTNVLIQTNFLVVQETNVVREKKIDTNIVSITNFVERIVVPEQEKRFEFDSKLSQIDAKILELQKNMERFFDILTNLQTTLVTKEEKLKDEIKIKELKRKMSVLSKTIDSLEERISIIDQYIEIRKKYRDKNLIVYSKQEYEQDIKIILEMDELLENIIKSLGQSK